MYEKFGEFDSFEEINELAENLKKEGDVGSIRELARENGLDEEMAELFAAGEIPFLCDAMSAAIGKIDAESAELKPVEIMEDWVNYLKARCFESEELARAVRRKGKSLKGAIAELLLWSLKNQNPVDKGILKAAGVSGRCKLGIPGMGRAKKIMMDYYRGDAK